MLNVFDSEFYMVMVIFMADPDMINPILFIIHPVVSRTNKVISKKSSVIFGITYSYIKFIPNFLWTDQVIYNLGQII